MSQAQLQRQQEIDAALDRQKLEALEEKVESLIRDRDNALKWGVLTLGAAVFGLLKWIFDLVRHST